MHNGIIENFLDKKKGLKFIPDSETDTSVIAQGLLENGVNDILGFIDFFQKVEGGFAIVGVNKNFSNTLFLAKRKNPLYVAKNEFNDVLVASDPICFSGFSREYFSFEDDEFAKVENGEILFFDSEKKIIEKQLIKLDEQFEETKKLNYETYMLKEIFEEEVVLKRQVDIYKKQKLFERIDENFIKKFNKVKLIGCGTAYHACLIGAKYFQKLLNIDATAEIASEFIYSSPNFIDEKTLVIFISQSGETAATLKALEIAKRYKSICLSFTNVDYSTLAKKSDYNFPICAGREIAVASTKAYVCQLSVLYMFACFLYNQVNFDKINYFVKIYNISNKILQFDELNIKNIAKNIYKREKFFFIGKDIDFVTALESALKINETTYINSSCYPSGELKHGYIALIEEGTPLFVFAMQSKLLKKSINSADEAFSRGAKRIVISNNNEIESEFKIILNEDDELLLPILAIAPIQYLSCEICRLKNINPDKPRNLAKSVTVE